jgi:hypothetical protein
VDWLLEFVKRERLDRKFDRTRAGQAPAGGWSAARREGFRARLSAMGSQFLCISSIRSFMLRMISTPATVTPEGQGEDPLLVVEAGIAGAHAVTDEGKTPQTR